MKGRGVERRTHARLILAVVYDLPVGMGRLAGFLADLLQRTIGPIHDQRQINCPRTRLQLASQTGNVGFLGHAFFKLQSQMTLGM